MSAQVTILIPFFNPGAYLPLAIYSVLYQTYENWKLILIDDASTENYLPGIQKVLSDSRIVLIKNINNQGQSKALNKGLEYVETPYVVQLDSDDLFYPNSLEVMVQEALKQTEKVGLICGNMKIFYEDGHGKIKRTRIKKGGSFEDPYKFLLANKTLCPRFYRTAALKKIGGWPTDDRYEGRYVEDLRILYRLIEQYNFHWIDQELYLVRIHQNNHTRQVEKYTEIMKWCIKNELQRLGDQFEPVFEDTKGGWIRLASLKPKGNHKRNS